MLLICQLFLIFYLAAKRIKKIEKDARSLAVSAMQDFDTSLDAAALQIRQKRREFALQIQEGIDHLNALNSAFDGMIAGQPALRELSQTNPSVFYAPERPDSAIKMVLDVYHFKHLIGPCTDVGMSVSPCENKDQVLRFARP